MQSAGLILVRALPPLRAEGGTVKIDLPADSLSAQGEAILQAAARGQITPAQASAMTTALAGLARIKEIGEFEERLAALEKAKATQ